MAASIGGIDCGCYGGGDGDNGRHNGAMVEGRRDREGEEGMAGGQMGGRREGAVVT